MDGSGRPYGDLTDADKITDLIKKYNAAETRIESQELSIKGLEAQIAQHNIDLEAAKQKTKKAQVCQNYSSQPGFQTPEICL